MRNFLVAFCIVLLFIQCNAQKETIATTSKSEATKTVEENQPKLVVGIVVDQMRYDYLTQFKSRYVEGGFNRMLSGGFNCKNTHYNYIPTYTGPGHASVYTGTTPANHGIIANDWYDKFSKSYVYCASDTTYTSVGISGLKEGKMSPHRMKTTTVTDQLRLATQQRGKVIGIAIKDRGAILPAGHAANAAYWFYGKDKGSWITSTYYMEQLPKWASDFNASDAAESYLKPWNTLYDIATYTSSGVDDNAFESTFKGKENAAFPYNLGELKDENGGFDILKATAYGNSLTTDFAIAAIKGEQLGTDDNTDFITISYSSTDYVGHRFGVNSKEIEDTYLRLDQDIERLLNTLDENVGAGNYTVFLTADHAAVHVPSYLQSQNIPAGYFDRLAFGVALKEFTKTTFGSAYLIDNMSNNQIFLDHDELKRLKLSSSLVQEKLQEYLLAYPMIDKVYTRTAMLNTEFTQGIASALQKGFNQKRSGDVLYVLDPATIYYSRTGSTHGSGFNYDTHVPLLFYGYGINQGHSNARFEIVDVAPTISTLLQITFPSGLSGNPIEAVLKN